MGRPRFSSGRRVLLVAFVLVAAGSCATLASEPGDTDAVRPNAGAGPFRAIRDTELKERASLAPYLLKNQDGRYREPSPLPLEQTSRIGPVALYVVGDRPARDSIYRFIAADARSFQADPTLAVLTPSAAWEGDALAGPSVHRVGDEVWLFYAASEGIGLARSPDGVSFRAGELVLGREGGAGWEGGQPPRSPGFIPLPSGEYRLYYEANDRLGEASSFDGRSFSRLGAAPILEPAGSGASADPPFDADAVGDPLPVLATSTEGRAVTRVYYTGRRADGSSAIGLAARFEHEGPLVRAVAPAYTAGIRAPAAPSLVRFGDVTMLYVSQKAGITASLDFPAIAAAVAPANVGLEGR